MDDPTSTKPESYWTESASGADELVWKDVFDKPDLAGGRGGTSSGRRPARREGGTSSPKETLLDGCGRAILIHGWWNVSTRWWKRTVFLNTVFADCDLSSQSKPRREARRWRGESGVQRTVD